MLNRKWLSVAIAGSATLGILTACAGPSAPSLQDTAPAPATAFKDGVAGAPAAPPEQVPHPVQEQRDVVKTASMTITVSDTSKAADKAAVIAENADGRVDNRAEDAGSDRGLAQSSVVLRVPVGKLDGVERELKTLGTVETAETTSEDVTAQRVDLDARIKALQTSVDRLLTIMRDAKDSEALIAAESALSERQADLDSLRAQRDTLGDRIEYSTVNVTFVAETTGGPAPKEYQGFVGHIEKGWDVFISVVGHLVLLFALLLPWLGVLAVAGGIAYGVIRLMRVRRSPSPVSKPDDEDSDSDHDRHGQRHQ